MDFAPVADVLTNSENQIVAKRSFGSDSELVTNMVLAEMNGFEETGILSCVKHFRDMDAPSAILMRVMRTRIRPGRNYNRKNWCRFRRHARMEYLLSWWRIFQHRM